MVISVEKELKFSVEYFEPTEGGMDSESFGKEVATLEEAVALLDVAEASNAGKRTEREWIIVARVKKIVKHGGAK